MFLSEDWSEILRVDSSIGAIPLFRVDVPSSSQGIRLGSEFPRTETNDEVEGRKKFGPSGLPTGKEFGGREVFQVLVVRENPTRNNIQPALWSSSDWSQACATDKLKDVGVTFCGGQLL